LYIHQSNMTAQHMSQTSTNLYHVNAPARCAATATVYGHRTLHSGHPNGATSSSQWGRLNGELSRA
jgi:hypothetical protein